MLREDKNETSTGFDVLAPGNTVGKLSLTTSVINELDKPEVRVRYYDIAQFGTKHERETDLAHFVKRRLPKINENDGTKNPKPQKNLLQKFWLPKD